MGNIHNIKFLQAYQINNSCRWHEMEALTSMEKGNIMTKTKYTIQEIADIIGNVDYHTHDHWEIVYTGRSVINGHLVVIKYTITKKDLDPKNMPWDNPSVDVYPEPNEYSNAFFDRFHGRDTIVTLDQSGQ